jgi:hypothetical protein
MRLEEGLSDSFTDETCKLKLAPLVQTILAFFYLHQFSVSLDRTLGGPHIWARHFREKKILLPLNGIETPDQVTFGYSSRTH